MNCFEAEPKEGKPHDGHVGVARHAALSCLSGSFRVGLLSSRHHLVHYISPLRSLFQPREPRPAASVGVSRRGLSSVDVQVLGHLPPASSSRHRVSSFAFLQCLLAYPLRAVMMLTLPSLSSLTALTSPSLPRQVLVPLLAARNAMLMVQLLPAPRTRRASRPAHKTCDTKRTPAPPRPPLISKKAGPTVSITNTNASRAGTACALSSTPTNFIPFPSAPIPVPSGRHDACSDDVDMTPRDVAGTEPSPALVDVSNDGSAPRNVRKRAKSSFSSELQCLQDEDENEEHARRAAKRAAHGKLEERSMAGRGRRLSMSAGSPAPAPIRRVRSARRGSSDTRFLAVVHRSIAARTCRTQQEAADAFFSEDVALAHRLWESLIEQGCQPVVFEDAQTPVFPAVGSPAPPPTPCLPSPAVDMFKPKTLTMPQLVATLTLRYRDGTANRPRTKHAKADSAGVHAPSSLSQVVFSVSDEPASA